MIPETTTHPTTAEAFDAWVLLPHNAQTDYEFIAGETRPVVSNNRASIIAMRIGARLLLYAEAKKLGLVTGMDGGYKIGSERYIPDVAFISKGKLPAPTTEAYVPAAPELVVEVLSPGNEPASVRLKLVNYLNAGTTVWLVDPDLQQVEVYAPNTKPLTLTGADAVIDGAPALPGFTLKLSDIFPADADSPAATE